MIARAPVSITRAPAAGAKVANTAWWKWYVGNTRAIRSRIDAAGGGKNRPDRNRQGNRIPLTVGAAALAYGTSTVTAKPRAQKEKAPTVSVMARAPMCRGS